MFNMGSTDKVKVVVRVRPFNRRGEHAFHMTTNNCQMAVMDISLLTTYLMLPLPYIFVYIFRDRPWDEMCGRHGRHTDGALPSYHWSKRKV